MSEGANADEDEAYAISDEIPAHDLSSTTTTQILESSRRNKKLVGLFDSGSRGNHIKRSVLRSVRYSIEKVDIKVTERYSSSRIKEIAVFECKLSDFCSSIKKR